MDASSILFNRTLHQALPHPLAHTYRKAFNSPTPKELHDNACLFGLCLLRLLATIALALVRELQVVLTREERDLLAKIDRPSEGDWHKWLGVSVQRIRERRLAPNSLGALIDAYLFGKRELGGSDLPGALGQLLSHVEKKPIIKKDGTVHDFLLALIRYRNDTAHGAMLPNEVNQANGEAILRAVAELAGTLPLGDRWELKYVARTALEATAVECQMIHLMGPDWLREPPLSYPRGYPAPLSGHVILMPKQGSERPVDLHPLVTFQNDGVFFFNSLRGKAPSYLEYASARKETLEGLAQDYEDWKKYFGAAAPAAGGEAMPPQVSSGGPAPAALPTSEHRFRFDRLLGRGGMGEVWSAYDETLKRQVAIKRVRREWLGRADIDRRFLQEARDAARLSHPNIVPILSIDSDSQGPYLVLEYMEGGSLRQLLQQGRLQLPVALAYLRQILQALQHAHGQALIHRDVKPENILLSKAGLPKLADFGLAWFFQEHDDESKDHGQSASEGTKAYLAPELQNSQDAPSPKSDLYSLGITFYEMLTARPPQPVDEKKVPSPALSILRKLIHPDPNLRYDTADSALRDCLELERALELAGRTEEETAARIRKTADQAFGLLAEGRSVDAQAGLERILAEDPENVRAKTGMLLMSLANGDMEQAATRYQALLALDAKDEVFGRFRGFVEGILDPTVLRMTPQPLPYSYRVEDLHRGQFIKELIEFGSDTVNVGDIGEVLIELAQKQPGRQAAYSRLGPDHHLFRLELERVRVEAEFRFRMKSKVFFLPARLLAADVTLAIAAEPFEIYRLVRYLTSNLARRFKRSSADWVRAEAALHFGYDARAALREWEGLTCNIQRTILLPK